MDEKQQKLLRQRVILEAKMKGTRLSSETIKDIKELATKQAQIEQKMLILDDNNIIS